MPAVMRPTLVIGVGGTGSEIAERIYQEGKRLDLVDDRRLLTVIGLDTNDYDHQRRRLKETNKVRFSTNKTIDEVLKRNADAEGTWFYRRDELPAAIRNMTLLDGAGMVRIFTRLALHDEFKHGGLENTLRSSLMGLTTVTNQGTYQGQINVLIIGSLAGGTGCGSFLQVAFAIRELAPSTAKLHVRGLFLMPDVYVRGAGLARDQVANVTTNGMAALREVNAILQATAHNKEQLESLNFEYMPGKRVKFGQIPYDIVTLIDYEMTNGQSLGPNLDHYKDLLARAAYTQLFLPLGQEVDERSVNSVQQKLAEVDMGTTNSYASVGVFSITYPEEAVLEHLTNRFASEILEGDWLVLDRAYRRRVDAYEDRRKEGDFSVKFPDRGASFIADLEQLARDRRPLFMEIRENVSREERQPDGGVITKISYEFFLKAFEAYVLAQFRSANEAVRQAYAAGRVSTARFEVRDDIADNVRRSEGRLDDLWRTFEDAARQVPDSVYDNYWASGLAMAASEWQDHHLQKHLVAPAPHLVEVRYFLYLALREVGKRLDELKPGDLYRDIVGAASAFGRAGERNKAPVEGRRAGLGPLDEATDLGEAGFAARLLSSRKYKNFVKRYARYFNTSLDSMQRYAEEVTLKRCLERLRSNLEQLLRLMELLFGDLESLQGELSTTIAEDRNRHAPNVGAQSGNRYVYAGPEAKDAMWNQIKPNVQGQKLGREANSQLVAALFTESRRRRSERSVNPERDSFGVRDLFRDAVIEKFCRRTIRDDLQGAYSFNVARAVRNEAELLGQEYESHMANLVQIIGRQAKPFVQVVNDLGSEFIYWAMHPDTKNEIGSAAFFDELFKYGESVNAVNGEEYDSRRLLCVDVKFNFPLTSVAKVQIGNRQPDSVYENPVGRYDAYYRESIEKVLDSDAKTVGRVRAKLSPHLDREWHKPTGLPEIFESVEVSSTNALYQEFVIAMGFDYLKKETDAGDPVVVFYNPTQLERGGNRSIVVYGQAIDKVLAEFKRRPDVARAARIGFGQWLAAARKRAETEDYRSFEQYQRLTSPELMAELLEIARNRTLRDVDGEVSRIVLAYFEVLNSMISTFRSDLEQGRVQQLFSQAVVEISDKALSRLRDNVNQDTFTRVEGIVNNIIQAAERKR
jgi:hypothetical protein